MDSLLLDADSGEVDEPAIGVFPKFSTGITMGAEILNGRMVRRVKRACTRARVHHMHARTTHARNPHTRTRSHATHSGHDGPHHRVELLDHHRHRVP